MTLAIRPATAADLADSIALLEEAGLPIADLNAEKLAFVAERDQEFLGVICLESFGEIAFLRSLVVSAKARGTGVGPALVAALEVACLANGVEEMWLLTIDADGFFVKLAYESKDRADAPDAIRDTEEYSGLCPSDAILMVKSLT
jgi:N-acetylglutamate synthase-like GNAT family acetyltransferase